MNSISVHEYGKENKNIIVMFHPLGIQYDVFEYVTQILEKDYHLIILAIPGLDPDNPKSEFTSIEDIESKITDYLINSRHAHVKCLYGCSMGGSLVIRMLASNKIITDFAVIDAGITPYEMNKFFTYCIGVRDWCMTQIGKYASVNALSSLFDPKKYKENDILYIKKVLNNLSSKTIQNGFYSTNNYSIPKDFKEPTCKIQY